MRSFRVIAAVALIALGAGCGSQAQKTTAPPTATSASSPSSAPTTTTATTEPATSAPTTGPASTTVPSTTPPTSGVLQCTTDHLSVSLGAAGAGAGHEGVTLLFRNTGSTACGLSGYPGVALLDKAGGQVMQAVRTPMGYLGGLASGSTTPPSVTVGPGQYASALLEGTDVPTGTATSCPDYPALLVTPPDQETSTRLEVAGGSAGGLPGCSRPQIHPVVEGRTGSQG